MDGEQLRGAESEISQKIGFLVDYLSKITGSPDFRVLDHYFEGPPSDFSLYHAENSPEAGVDAYFTAGLSDYPIYKEGVKIDVRVELVGAAYRKFPDYMDVLTCSAMCISRLKWFCAPGVIFPDAVGYASLTLSDIYFANPFLWNELKTQKIEGRAIAWLHALPISRSESNYAIENGTNALEDLFVGRGINVFDLNREPII